MSPARRRRPTSVTGGLALATVASGLLALLATGCGTAPAAPVPVPQAQPVPVPQARAAAVPQARSAAVPPPVPQPASDEPCHYLSAEVVRAANGERVRTVRVSQTGPDQPYPACFFLATDGTVQLRTWIVVATPEVARATVDAVAPVATSDLAELPGGWSGGSQPTADGAVFAVSRNATAVVITTNQRQTISARQLAKQVITALGL